MTATLGVAIGVLLAGPTAAGAVEVGPFALSNWNDCSPDFIDSGSWDERGNLYIACGTRILVYNAAGQRLADIQHNLSSSDVAPSPDANNDGFADHLYLARGNDVPKRINRGANGTYAVDAAWKLSGYPHPDYSPPNVSPAGNFIETDAAGRIYLADGIWTEGALLYEGQNTRRMGGIMTVVKYNADGAFVNRFGIERGPNGWEPDQIYKLSGIAVSRDGGTVYTLDQLHNRIQRWELQENGTYAATGGWGATAQEPNSQGNCNSPGQAGQQIGPANWIGEFASPYDIAMDESGHIYVMNTTCHEVLQFTPAGAFVTGIRVSVDNQPGAQATNRPHAFAVSRDGKRVYVAQAQKVATRNGGGGGGPAEPTCRGKAVTRAGVVGTPDDDVLVGTAGNDHIDGKGGNDTLCGGDGFDSIRGGAGNDVIDGQGGGDAVDYGFSPAGVVVDLGSGEATGEGSDQLYSLTEAYGTPHADTLRGSNVNGSVLEYLAGTAGIDRIEGRGGRDLLEGGSEDDVLTGGGGRDTLKGQAGRDSLAARDGEIDAVDCGADGDPVAVVDPNDSRLGCELVDDGGDRGDPDPDRRPPETTIRSGPAGTVSARDARFEFAASEPGRFECRLDGAAFGPCGTPAAFAGLSPGPHRFEVRAIDAAGNVDPTPAARIWTVAAPPEPFSCQFSASGSKLAKALKRGVLVFFECSKAARVQVRSTIARSTAYRLGLVRSRKGGRVTVASGSASGTDGRLRVRFRAKARRLLRGQTRIKLTLPSKARSTQTRELSSGTLKITLKR